MSDRDIRVTQSCGEHVMMEFMSNVNIDPVSATAA